MKFIPFIGIALYLASRGLKTIDDVTTWFLSIALTICSLLVIILFRHPVQKEKVFKSLGLLGQRVKELIRSSTKPLTVKAIIIYFIFVSAYYSGLLGLFLFALVIALPISWRLVDQVNNSLPKDTTNPESRLSVDILKSTGLLITVGLLSQLSDFFIQIFRGGIRGSQETADYISHSLILTGLCFKYISWIFFSSAFVSMTLYIFLHIIRAPSKKRHDVFIALAGALSCAFYLYIGGSAPHIEIPIYLICCAVVLDIYAILMKAPVEARLKIAFFITVAIGLGLGTSASRAFTPRICYSKNQHFCYSAGHCPGDFDCIPQAEWRF